jgi:hypothetical protein
MWERFKAGISHSPLALAPGYQCFKALCQFSKNSVLIAHRVRQLSASGFSIQP